MRWYWEALEEQLEEDGLVRFASLFATYSERNLPARGLQRVEMPENFRSGQSIIDHAERVLSDIPVGRSRLGEHGLATTSAPGVVRFITDEGVESVVKTVHDFISRCQRRDTAKQTSAGDEPPVLVLARTQDRVRKVETALRAFTREEREPVRVMTYHSSKGLEADYTVLIEDCEYRGEFPMRNLIYKLAGFPASDDESQLHEAWRLGYVAPTRARDRASPAERLWDSS